MIKFRAKKKRSKKESEADIQEAFFKAISCYPTIRKRCFHIPNGGKRSISQAVALKRQGVLSGVSDVFVAIPNRVFNGSWIEFKCGRNVLTENQAIFFDEMRDSGFDCQVFYTWHEAFDYLKEYLTETVHRIL